MRKWGSGQLVLAGLILAVMLGLAAGCSSNDKSESSSMSQVSVAAEAESLSNKSLAGADFSKNIVSAKDQYGQETGAGSSADNAASPSAAANPGFSIGGADSEGINRKLIYKGNLTMKVKNYSEAQSEIRNMVTLSGGYILQFSENSTNHEEGGQFVLKIPSSGFSSFMNDIEKIPHTSLQRSVQAQDVSEEYVDLEARLKVKQVLEARYLEFMQNAAKTEDLVTYTNELGKVQEIIEQTKGRMRYIDQNVAYSTVEIRVYQPEGRAAAGGESGSGHVLDRAKDAMGKSFDVLSAFGQGLIVWIAALLPVIVILSILGIPVWLWYRKRKKTVQ
ncbi:MAG: hypothetical protein K0R57_5327 [Paenibacillaceae bacterium]|jgi:hypothetical protein|nr:hypothetical protein [Paenibacillaceae bacterium]